jgi:hypothetical protein
MVIARQAPQICPPMIPVCSRFDSVLFTPKMPTIAGCFNLSRSLTLKGVPTLFAAPFQVQVQRSDRRVAGCDASAASTLEARGGPGNPDRRIVGISA